VSQRRTVHGILAGIRACATTSVFVAHMQSTQNPNKIYASTHLPPTDARPREGKQRIWRERRRQRHDLIEPYRVRALVWRVSAFFLSRHTPVAVEASDSVSGGSDASVSGSV
jgi:hypothetical protein